MARETAWRQRGSRPSFDLRLKASCQVVRVGPWRRPGWVRPSAEGPWTVRAAASWSGGTGANATRPFWSSSQAVCSSGTSWTLTWSSRAGEPE